MSQDSASVSERERRLEQVLADYVRSLEAGQPLDEEKLLAEHSDLADDLRSFFRNLSAVEKLAKPLIAAADTPTIGLAATAPAEDGKLVRYFGDYELLAEIARGGMGVVYKARQRSLGRLVALKMILAGQLASSADVQRFRQEAEAAANLDHPGIVPIFEIGEHEGQHYFSMKLIEGGSLRDRLVGPPPSGGDPSPSACREPVERTGEGRGEGDKAPEEMLRRPVRPYDQRTAAALIADIARAVHHAHQRGVLHRDLKPGNILLDADGQPHITDFGLAKRVEGGSDLTQSGAVVGTPAYMAPEQAQAKTQLTTAADIYSLGAILYQLLTGQSPHEGDSPAETLLALLSRDPVAPRSINPSINRDLETICLKCLERDPQRRYDSAAAVAADLIRWLADEPILARPDPLSMRLARLLRRHRIWFQAAAASLAVILVGLVVALLFVNSAKEKATDLAASLNKEIFRLGISEYARGNRDEAISAIAKVHDSTAEGDPLRRSTCNLLGAWLGAAPIRALPGGSTNRIAFSPDGASVLTGGRTRILDRMRGEARLWDAHSGMPIGEPILYETLSGQPWTEIEAVAYSPDGRTVFVGRDLGDAGFYDARTGKATGVSVKQDSVRAAAYSPDGAILLTGSKDKTARLWDAHSGAPIGDPIKHHGAVSAVAFSPDGAMMLTASGNQVLTWDALSRTSLGEPIKHHGALAAAIFSPDSRTVLTAGGTSAELWDARTGKPLGKQMVHKANVNEVAYSPRGTTILTGSGSESQDAQHGEARLWDAHSGLPVGEPMKHDGIVLAVAYSPDGTMVLTGSRDLVTSRGEAALWDAESGKRLGTPMIHDDGVTEVRFSPDGATFLTASGNQKAHGGEVRLWDARGRLIGPSMKHAQAIQAVAFSPDGATIATGCDDGRARLWDARSGKLIGEPMKSAQRILCVAFSPDGALVATGSGDKTARLWNARNGKPLGEALKQNNIVSIIAFSPDGKTLLTAGNNLMSHGSRVWWASGEVRIWDVVNRTPIGEPIKHDGLILGAVFSPDGATILTGSGNSAEPIHRGEARLWDARTGKPVSDPMMHGSDVTAVAYSPDGATVLTGSTDDRARLWNARRGKLITEAMKHDKAVSTVAFSPSGETVLTGSLDATARLWDAQSGKPIGEPMEHDGALTSVAYSRDGATVLTVSWDHTARLWDAWSGVPISEPMKHNAWVNAATFAFDGATVLTATGGEKPGEARLWYSPRPIPERLFNLIADTHVRGRYSERNVDEYLRYLSAWEKLATEGAEWLAERRKFDERRTIGWHHYEAAEAEDRGDWFAAEFHLRWLLKSAPDDADLKKRHERVARELAAVRRSSAETTQKAQNKTERAEDKR